MAATGWASTRGSRLVRRYGHWVRLDARKLKVGRYLFARHGGAIVFLGRLITSLRPYAAFFAGLNAMRRSRFLAVDAAAGAVWAAACSFGAYALGSEAIRAGTALTIGGLAIAGLLTIMLTLVIYRTMHRFEERAAAAVPDPPRIPRCKRATRRRPECRGSGSRRSPTTAAEAHFTIPSVCSAIRI